VSFTQKYMGQKTCTFALYGDGAKILMGFD